MTLFHMVMDFMEYGELCLCLRSLDIQSRQNNQFMVALLMIIVNLQAKLKEALSAPVEALLDGASNETWPAIRKLLRRETEAAVSGLSGALSGFDMDEQTKDKMLATIEDYARGIVEAKAREEAGRALIRMKDR
jgi:hypothetical protein